MVLSLLPKYPAVRPLVSLTVFGEYMCDIENVPLMIGVFCVNTASKKVKQNLSDALVLFQSLQS